MKKKILIQFRCTLISYTVVCWIFSLQSCLLLLFMFAAVHDETKKDWVE